MEVEVLPLQAVLAFLEAFPVLPPRRPGTAIVPEVAAELPAQHGLTEKDNDRGAWGDVFVHWFSWRLKSGCVLIAPAVSGSFNPDSGGPPEFPIRPE